MKEKVEINFSLPSDDELSVMIKENKKYIIFPLDSILEEYRKMFFYSTNKGGKVFLQEKIRTMLKFLFEVNNENKHN